MHCIGIDNRLEHHRPAGIARYTRNLFQALQELAPPEEFIVWRHRREAEERFSRRGWSSRILYSPVHHAWEQRMLQAELGRFRVHLAHFPDFICPYLTRRRCVITAHDLGFLHWPELLDEEAAAYYAQLDRAIEHAAAIITHTHFNRDDLLDAFPAARGKTHVVNSGVDPQFLRQENAVLPPLAQLPARYLLHVGTLEPRKNLDVLIKALTIIRREKGFGDVTLALAGASGWKNVKTLDLIRELQLEEVCHLTGFLSDADLRRAYRHAQCLVHPAIHEGFGFTLLEAMALGVPVVASRTACLPEIAGDAALYAEPWNAEEFAENIMRLLGDEDLRKKQTEKGTSRVKQFSWRNTALATLEVYRSVLGD